MIFGRCILPPLSSESDLINGQKAAPSTSNRRLRGSVFTLNVFCRWKMSFGGALWTSARCFFPHFPIPPSPEASCWCWSMFTVIMAASVRLASLWSETWWTLWSYNVHIYQNNSVTIEQKRLKLKKEWNILHVLLFTECQIKK